MKRQYYYSNLNYAEKIRLFGLYLHLFLNLYFLYFQEHMLEGLIGINALSICLLLNLSIIAILLLLKIVIDCNYQIFLKANKFISSLITSYKIKWRWFFNYQVGEYLDLTSLAVMLIFTSGVAFIFIVTLPYLPLNLPFDFAGMIREVSEEGILFLVIGLGSVLLLFLFFMFTICMIIRPISHADINYFKRLETRATMKNRKTQYWKDYLKEIYESYQYFLLNYDLDLNTLFRCTLNPDNLLIIDKNNFHQIADLIYHLPEFGCVLIKNDITLIHPLILRKPVSIIGCGKKNPVIHGNIRIETDSCFIANIELHCKRWDENEVGLMINNCRDVIICRSWFECPGRCAMKIYKSHYGVYLIRNQFINSRTGLDILDTKVFIHECEFYRNQFYSIHCSSSRIRIYSSIICNGFLSGIHIFTTNLIMYNCRVENIEFTGLNIWLSVVSIMYSEIGKGCDEGISAPGGTLIKAYRSVLHNISRRMIKNN